MGTPALVAAVNAIGNWLQKRRSVSLTIVTAEKKIVAENLTNKDAARLLPNLARGRLTPLGNESGTARLPVTPCMKAEKGQRGYFLCTPSMACFIGSVERRETHRRQKAEVVSGTAPTRCVRDAEKMPSYACSCFHRV
jgi:hypothetical protein